MTVDSYSDGVPPLVPVLLVSFTSPSGSKLVGPSVGWNLVVVILGYVEDDRFRVNSVQKTMNVGFRVINSLKGISGRFNILKFMRCKMFR